ncbi:MULTISPECIES: small secreted protein [unclassified Streptomyces]|uniref:small secreted protein n=1 Tax=unclassified Streptomyces TaxID=2593676 RepID=UPI003D705F08
MEGTKPVNKKLAAALSGGAVLVLALSGCTSGDDGNDKELDAWAKQICDVLPAQKAKVTSASAAITKVADQDSAPAEVQKTDSQAFQDMSDAYKALADAVRRAGPPPGVEDGKKKQEDAVKALTDLSTSYAGLKKEIDSFDTKNQGTFAGELKKLGTRLGNLSKSGNAALRNLEEGDVKAAVARQDSCQKASRTASPTAGSTRS